MFISNAFLSIASMLWVFSFSLNNKCDHELTNDRIRAVSYHDFGKQEDNKIIITQDIDLQGSKISLPDSVTLFFKGGVLRNGTLIGKNSQIIWNDVIFDRINIRGSWIVPQISSEMFADLSYINALKDVIALTNPCVNNYVRIGKGKYLLDIPKNHGRCLLINSNTTLDIDGTIELKPNSHEICSMLYAEGSNIHIKGIGKIVGDKLCHIGKTGEWGMGIRFHGVINGSIEGIGISNCWGDCIYVSGNSNHLLIQNCKLEGGRRQGISITSAKNMVIRNCNITGIEGTWPGYGIDIEPNKNDTCRNILIEKVNVIDSKGGLEVFCKAEKAYAGDVTIRDCKIEKIKKSPMRFVGCSNVFVERCTLPKNNKEIVRESVRNLSVKFIMFK